MSIGADVAPLLTNDVTIIIANKATTQGITIAIIVEALLFDFFFGINLLKLFLVLEVLPSLVLLVLVLVLFVILFPKIAQIRLLVLLCLIIVSSENKWFAFKILFTSRVEYNIFILSFDLPYLISVPLK